METLRGVTVISVAELLVLGAFTPFVEANEDSRAEHRRGHHHHHRAHAHPTTVDRGDYPVIFNWLNSPESSQNSTGLTGE
ncbi:hypothetical protein GC163_16450 [bacterium]|nr:hypothetical protein [bacterium]